MAAATLPRVLIIFVFTCVLQAATSCIPQAPAKKEPANISELHPGHVSVVIGLGDSMMAGFAAGAGPDIFHLGLLQENREVSFGSGVGSSDHRTLPYYLKQYNASLVGASSGVHPLETPVGSGIAGGMFDGYRYPKNDQLNLALSIGQSWDLRQEIQQLKVLSKNIDAFEDRWKVLTLMIGANDLSHSSACTNTSQSEVVANTFAIWMEDALRDIVKSFDKIYVKS